jgi:hypothetical protein
MTDYICPTILAFREELEYIESVELAEFMKVVFEHAPASFYLDEELVAYTKQVFYVVKGILEGDSIRGTFRDMVYTAVLLSDLLVNEFTDEYKVMHPVALQPFLDKLNHKLPAQMLEAIMTVVEGHESSNSPSKQLDPKPGSPAFMVGLVHKVLRQQIVQVNI